MVWKNTIATDHTEGEPPSRGSTILVNIGSIWNKSAALRKMAAVEQPRSERVRRIAQFRHGRVGRGKSRHGAGCSGLASWCARPGLFRAATLTIARGASMAPHDDDRARDLVRRRRGAPARA